MPIKKYQKKQLEKQGKYEEHIIKVEAYEDKDSMFGEEHSSEVGRNPMNDILYGDY